MYGTVSKEVETEVRLGFKRVFFFFRKSCKVSYLKLFILVGWERSSSFGAWSIEAQLIIFFGFRFPVVLFGRLGISICHTTRCICRVLIFSSS